MGRRGGDPATPRGPRSVALDSSSLVTRAAESDGCAEMMSAAAADAYGVAIDVPVAEA